MAIDVRYGARPGSPSRSQGHPGPFLIALWKSYASRHSAPRKPNMAGTISTDQRYRVEPPCRLGCTKGCRPSDTQRSQRNRRSRAAHPPLRWWPRRTWRLQFDATAPFPPAQPDRRLDATRSPRSATDRTGRPPSVRPGLGTRPRATRSQPSRHPDAPRRWRTGPMTTRPRFGAQLLAALGRRTKAFRAAPGHIEAGFARQLVRALARDTPAFSGRRPIDS
jgi:hypothetical protein